MLCSAPLWRCSAACYSNLVLVPSPHSVTPSLSLTHTHAMQPSQRRPPHALYGQSVHAEKEKHVPHNSPSSSQTTSSTFLCLDQNRGNRSLFTYLFYFTSFLSVYSIFVHHRKVRWVIGNAYISAHNVSTILSSLTHIHERKRKNKCKCEIGSGSESKSESQSKSKSKGVN